MGQNISAHSSFTESQKLFNTEEKENIKKLVHLLSNEKSKDVLDENKFKSYIEKHLPKFLADNLYNEMCNITYHIRGVNTLTAESFNISLAHILKGNVFQRANVIYKIASPHKTVKAEELFKFVVAIISAYYAMTKNSPNLATWKLRENPNSVHRLAQHLLQELLWPDMKNLEKAPDREISEEDIQHWLQTSIISASMIKRVFHLIFPVTPAEQLMAVPIIPLCESVDWTRFETMLDISDLLTLNNHCPLDYRNVWRLLYASTIHGESFIRLARHIVYAGPVIIVIKEKNGNIFGGFSSVKLTINPHFQGNDSCFVFSLTPHLKIYHSSEMNDNYVYINVNQQTLPNCFAFGGQINYFGVAVESSVTTGNATNCLTYKCPQLSTQHNFTIESLEVWGVGPEAPERKAYLQKRFSMLDADPDVVAMLTLLNRGPHSEGMREDDPSSENPEIKNFVYSDKSAQNAD